MFVLNYKYVGYALLGTLFTFFVTSLGAFIVFLFKNPKKNFLNISNALAAGIMIAASFYSLLNPAYNFATMLNMIPYLVILVGFISGGLLLYLFDRVFEKKVHCKEKNKLKRLYMLIFSITLHNIPEGLVVGCTFGSLFYSIPGVSLISAITLTLGIGIQNFPEGALVSLPLKQSGVSSKKAFIIGSLTGIVEPIAGVLGALLVIKTRSILPFLLSFAAGAMIYVATGELIPECLKDKNANLMTLFIIFGFSLMMFLDLMFG